MEDRWAKLEEIVRRVVKEEISALGKKPRITLVNGKWVGITQEQKEAWAAAYGAVDIEGELRAAAAWIVSNPDKAPSAQVARFLNTWLSRSQQRSAIRSIPTQSERQAQSLKLCSYCTETASAKISGIWACSGHTQDAMDGRPIPMMKSMLGVVAKPVAGRD